MSSQFIGLNPCVDLIYSKLQFMCNKYLQDELVADYYP